MAYLLASEDTIQREFGVYDRVRDNFPKYVIALDAFDMSQSWIKHRCKLFFAGLQCFFVLFLPVAAHV